MPLKKSIHYNFAILVSVLVLSFTAEGNYSNTKNVQDSMPTAQIEAPDGEADTNTYKSTQDAGTTIIKPNKVIINKVEEDRGEANTKSVHEHLINYIK